MTLPVAELRLPAGAGAAQNDWRMSNVTGSNSDHRYFWSFARVKIHNLNSNNLWEYLRLNPTSPARFRLSTLNASGGLRLVQQLRTSSGAVHTQVHSGLPAHVIDTEYVFAMLADFEGNLTFYLNGEQAGDPIDISADSWRLPADVIAPNIFGNTVEDRDFTCLEWGIGWGALPDVTDITEYETGDDITAWADAPKVHFLPRGFEGDIPTSIPTNISGNPFVRHSGETAYLVGQPRTLFSLGVHERMAAGAVLQFAAETAGDLYYVVGSPEDIGEVSRTDILAGHQENGTSAEIDDVLEAVDGTVNVEITGLLSSSTYRIAAVMDHGEGIISNAAYSNFSTLTDGFIVASANSDIVLDNRLHGYVNNLLSRVNALGAE